MSEAIARQIEEQIQQGQLRPDDMLPAESQLMKEFGVARNTVREALRMLEASGLVKIRQGSRGGTVIARMNNEFVSDFLMRSVRLGGISGEAFHAFRVAIEPSIAEIVAGKETMDPAILSEMKSRMADAKALYESGKPTVLANMDFHVLLADATENMMFIVLLRTLRAGFTEVAPLNKEPFRLETINYHGRILQAIEDHDPARARVLMYDHLIEIGQVTKTEDFLKGEG
jgi:GntR family transcriptional regulator, transcriptional repressor for pyruvate dehydrogenase complex